MGMLAMVIIRSLGPSAFWLIAVIPTVLIGIDVVFLVLARRRMQAGFRSFLTK
jgi:hypothetical protein